MLEFARFDRLVLVQGRVRDPEFDACGVHSPRQYNLVGVLCLVSRVRNVDVATHMLGSVYWVLCLVSQVRNANVATDMLGSWIGVQGSLQVVVEKIVERSKGNVELLNS